MSEVLQILGATMVLAGFVSVQRALVDPQAVAYLLLNFAGSGLLAVLALAGRQWGFLLLEASWAGVSFVGMASSLRRRRTGRRERRSDT